MNNPYIRLSVLASSRRELHAVVETPKGNRNKYKFEPDDGLFMLHKVLRPARSFLSILATFPARWARMAIRWMC